VEDPSGRASVNSLLVGDRAKADQLYTRMGRGTYWIGKGLGATAQLLNVAEAQGNITVRDELLGKLRLRLQSWFDGGHANYFYHDATTGTFAGLPQEYDSVLHMNDHHFHYGYWVMAAAQIALRDPQWASEPQWGGMVHKIIADIATAERGRADFPFLRNFDVYEGHSWASGDAAFDAGNNQESSSEAVNAWAGLILWGEAIGDQTQRDLGIYLYTSEVASIDHYWFDLDHEVFAMEYGQPFASMVFGGKYSYNTWWTQEPRQILGINELPMTTASVYLGRKAGNFSSLAARLPAEVKAYGARGGNDGTPPDIWQDIIASAVALDDPETGWALWRRGGSVEFGETRTHTNHWLLRLKELGPPDFTVTADTPLYAVFQRRTGERTYLAYNASPATLKVTFSDGRTMEVAAHSLAQAR
jgi:endoglucanase Acf2